MLGRANPRMKKEGAIYRPTLNVAVGAGKHDRNFRFKFEPDIPVVGQRLVFLFESTGKPDNPAARKFPVGNFRLPPRPKLLRSLAIFASCGTNRKFLQSFLVDRIFRLEPKFPVAT